MTNAFELIIAFPWGAAPDGVGGFSSYVNHEIAPRVLCRVGEINSPTNSSRDALQPGDKGPEILSTTLVCLYIVVSFWCVDRIRWV